ncbi:MAG TPA: L-lysine dehydrogenase, partial [Fibrella sp.]
MQNLVVVGLGKVGSLVGLLLHKRFTISGFDRQAPAHPLPFPVLQGNVSDTEALYKALQYADGVVSCLPY